MSLETRLRNLATRIGTEIKTVRTEISSLPFIPLNQPFTTIRSFATFFEILQFQNLFQYLGVDSDQGEQAGVRVDPNAGQVHITGRSSSNGWSDPYVIIRTNLLTANKIYEFPNDAGGLLTLTTEEHVANVAITRIMHGSDGAFPRPAEFSYVEWVGSVEPTNATNNDTWIQTV